MLIWSVPSESVVVPTKKPKSKEVVEEKPQEKVESDTEEIDSNLLQKLIKEAQEWKEKQKKIILDNAAPVDLLRSSGTLTPPSFIHFGKVHFEKKNLFEK